MSSGTGVEIEIPRVTDSGADRQDSVASTEFATIVDGEETLADFDARSAFAGRLRATVLIDGAALQNLIIEVIPSTGAFDPQAAIPRVERVAASRIGEDGVATFSAIPPGKVRLYVYPAEYSKSAGAGNPSWNWLSPEVFEIRPGEETNLSLSIAIVKGEVLILDESGAPVVSHWFELGFDQESLDRQIMTVMTDPAGKLALRLAPGNYRIRGIDAKSRKVTPATFEWTQYGPAVGSLRVVIRK
jgi:hypothetical protein